MAIRTNGIALKLEEKLLVDGNCIVDMNSTTQSYILVDDTVVTATNMSISEQRSVTLILKTQATGYNLSFNPNWNWSNTNNIPTRMEPNETLIFTVQSTGDSNSHIYITSDSLPDSELFINDTRDTAILPQNYKRGITVELKNDTDLGITADGLANLMTVKPYTSDINVFATQLLMTSQGIKYRNGQVNLSDDWGSWYTIADKDWVITEINTLINNAPAALDTLNELAAALGDDPNFATTVTTQINNKVDKIVGKGLSTNDFTDSYKLSLDNLSTNLDSKVDKIVDKGLSTNDYTDTDKNLVNDIPDKVDKVAGKGLSTNDLTDILLDSLWTKVNLTNLSQLNNDLAGLATLSSVSGDGNSSVTFTKSDATTVVHDFSHTHSEYLPLTGGTLTGHLTLDYGKQIKSAYNVEHGILIDHNNGNITLNAAGNDLYLGSNNTLNIRLSKALHSIASGIVIDNQEIYANYNYDGNDGAVRINRFGYQGAQERFRDTVIYNGKGIELAHWDGSSGGVIFKHSGNNKLEVTSSGIAVTGSISSTYISTDTGTSSTWMRTDVDDTVSGHTTWDSGKKVIIGTNGISLNHVGTGYLINSSGSFYIKNEADNSNLFLRARNTGVDYTAIRAGEKGAHLYYDNNTKLSTTDSGINVIGDITINDNTLSSLYLPLTGGIITGDLKMQYNNWYYSQYSADHDELRMNANTNGDWDFYNQTQNDFTGIRARRFESYGPVDSLKYSFLDVKRGTGTYLKFQTDSLNDNNVSQFVIRRSSDNLDLLSIGVTSKTILVDNISTPSHGTSANWKDAYDKIGYIERQDTLGTTKDFKRVALSSDISTAGTSDRYVVYAGDDPATTWYTAKVKDADNVPWSGITGKPSSFTPSTHNHDSLYVKITGSTMTGDLWGTRNKSILGNFIANPNPESNIFFHYGLVNDLAHIRKRGVTITNNMGLSDAQIDSLFAGSSDFINITSSSVPAEGIIFEIDTPRTFTYGTGYGIAFGNSNWRTHYVKLESYRNGAWQTDYETSSNATDIIVKPVLSNDANGVSKYRITLKNGNSSSIRLTQIFSYTYNSNGTEALYLGKGGGTVYGDLSIDKQDPRLDFYSNQSGSSVGGRLELNENGNFWINAQDGKDLWLNWRSPNAQSLGADVNIGDGKDGSYLFRVEGDNAKVILGRGPNSYYTRIRGGFYQTDYITESNTATCIYTQNNALYIRGGADGSYGTSVDLDSIQIRYSGGFRKIYHEGYKPSAVDVGALALSGGTVTGKLTTNSGSYAPLALARTGTNNLNIQYTHDVGTRYLGMDSSNNLRWGDNADSNQNPHVYTTSYRPSAADVGALPNNGTWTGGSGSGYTTLAGSFKATGNTKFTFYGDSGKMDVITDGEFYASEGGKRVYHEGYKPSYSATDVGAIAKSGTVSSITGNKEFSGTDTSGVYSTSPIEIREVGLVTSGQSSDAYAPAIAWHWGARAQGQLALNSNGQFVFRDGSTHSSFKTLKAGNIYTNNELVASQTWTSVNYAAKSHSHSYLSTSGGTITGNTTLNGDFTLNGFVQNNSESGHWINGESTYVYDGTNGTRYMWIKIANGYSSTGSAILEYYCKSDVNYSYGVTGRVVVSNWVDNSFSCEHYTTSPNNSVTPLVRIDSSRNVWIQFWGCAWSHVFKYRWIYRNGNGVKSASGISQEATPTNSTEVKEGQQIRVAWANLGSMSSQTATDTMRVHGSLNARRLYENGTSLDSKYAAYSHSHSYLSTSGGTLSGDLTISGKTSTVGTSSNWDEVGSTKMSKIRFQGHSQFWIGAGNGTWFTGTANTKNSTGLATDATQAHDLLITSMQATSTTDRGITFAVASNGSYNTGWRLGKWHSGVNSDSSVLAIDGTLVAKGGRTNHTDYYSNDFSVHYDDGEAGWKGSGMIKASIVAADAMMIQSGSYGTSATNPVLYFHQYGYGGPEIRYNGPNDTLHIQNAGTNSGYFSGLEVTGYITASGDVTAFSDIRLKTDITPLSNSLSKIKQLQGVTYKRIDSDNDDLHIGLVAQEVEKILPELVKTHKDEDKTKSVNYQNLTAVLVEAIKEQQEEIDELKNKVSEIDSLKAEIQILKDLISKL